MENPTNLNPICPICNNPLKNEEQLIAYYYAPKKWWVVQHVGPDEYEFTGNQDKLTIEKTRTLCALANWRLEKN